jgi:hypothetical protein
MVADTVQEQAKDTMAGHGAGLRSILALCEMLTALSSTLSLFSAVVKTQPGSSQDPKQPTNILRGRFGKAQPRSRLRAGAVWLSVLAMGARP